MIHPITNLPYTVEQACNELNGCNIVSVQSALNLIGILNCKLYELLSQQKELEIMCNPLGGLVLAWVNEATTPPTLMYSNPDGTPYTGADPVSCNADREIIEGTLKVTVAGSYGAVNDIIQYYNVFDVSVVPRVLLETFYINKTTQTVVTGITTSNTELYEGGGGGSVSLTDYATETKQNTIITKLDAILAALQTKVITGAASNSIAISNVVNTPTSGVLYANPSRKGGYIQNIHDTADIWINEFGAASAGVGVRLYPGGKHDITTTNTISMIASAATSGSTVRYVVW